MTAATTTAEPSRRATPPEAVSTRGTPNSGCVPVTHALIGKKNILFSLLCDDDSQESDVEVMGELVCLVLRGISQAESSQFTH